MWDLFALVLAAVSISNTGVAPAPALAPAADVPVASAPAPVPVASAPALVRVDATNRGKKLPKAAARALRRGQAELWAEGERLIVRPTDAWLRGGEWRTGHLDVSDDAGRTWRRVELPACGNMDCILRLERGGALQMMTGHEAPCGGGFQSRSVGHVDGREWQDAPWSWDSPVHYSLPADGWAAGECRPADTLKDAWHGPDEVVCLIDLAGHEVYLPVPWGDDDEPAYTLDAAAGFAEAAGQRIPLAAPAAAPASASEVP